ncbi:MAG: peptide chain release factor aRF-1 [Thaumarchaeota archaeon]|nr:peptide chain release factor aRF-1 [Candidatus Calditenuaceae archaeon]MDW8043018.1 peptide chain release factor aRF-1 [Nitrososphaerota archaeon]
MSGRDSVSLYKFKRFIEELERKEGRGTELVSLYIPPGKRVDEVIGYLRQEYSTAANIKSKSTRKNVMSAIESAIQRLKLYREVGPNGLIIFSGAISHGGPGEEKVEVYDIVPPEPLNLFLYRCDSKFYLEPLRDLLKERDVYGVLVIDNEEAAVAVLKGRKVVELKVYTSGVPGKHRAGGQSARRFERLRDQALEEYYKRVADHANEVFLSYPEIRAVIVAGPGPTKEVFVQGNYLHYSLRDKVKVVDTSYSGEEGVREAIERAADELKELRLVMERRVVEAVMRMATQGSGVVYGERQVRQALARGELRRLVVNEDLDAHEVTISCSKCGYSERVTMNSEQLVSELPKRLGATCPSCGNASLLEAGREPLVDVLIREAESTGTQVELISSDHEAGEMFLRMFGGIAGILKSAQS